MQAWQYRRPGQDWLRLDPMARLVRTWLDRRRGTGPEQMWRYRGNDDRGYECEEHDGRRDNRAGDGESRRMRARHGDDGPRSGMHDSKALFLLRFVD
jgi:hypothetical protein